jgi:hypothetical protein
MTEEQRANLTPEERERLERAEQEALEILNRKMREGRWYPRRHMRFAFFVILGLFAALGLVFLVGYLLKLIFG